MVMLTRLRLVLKLAFDAFRKKDPFDAILHERDKRSSLTPADRRPVFIATLGQVSIDDIYLVVETIHQTFGLETHFWKKIVPIPEAAFEDGHYDGDVLIRQLGSNELPLIDGRLFVMIGRNVSSRRHGFLHGYSFMHEPVSIMSLSSISYDGDHPERFLNRRIVKVTMHELGHSFGLPHCPDDACVMREVPQVSGLEGMSFEFCTKCSCLIEAKKVSPST